MSEQRDSYFLTWYVVGCVVVTWWCKYDVSVDDDVEDGVGDDVDGGVGDDVDDGVGDEVVLMTMTMMLTTHCKGAASFYAKWWRCNKGYLPLPIMGIQTQINKMTTLLSS